MLSISYMIMNKSVKASKNMSTPFAAKMIYVGLLGQAVKFINNHGLYPRRAVKMESLAPDLFVGYNYIVEKKKPDAGRFKELVAHFSGKSSSKHIASDIKKTLSSREARTE